MKRGWIDRDGRYSTQNTAMEKGFSLKSLMAASRVEAFLRTGDHGDRVIFFGSGRRMGSGEMLWKADGHFGRSRSAGRRELVLEARVHARANMLKVYLRDWKL